MTSQNETLFPYEPENTKHVYGQSDRWPAEKIIVRHINEIHKDHSRFALDFGEY